MWGKVTGEFRVPFGFVVLCPPDKVQDWTQFLLVRTLFEPQQDLWPSCVFPHPHFRTWANHMNQPLFSDVPPQHISGWHTGLTSYLHISHSEWVRLCDQTPCSCFWRDYLHKNLHPQESHPEKVTQILEELILVTRFELQHQTPFKSFNLKRSLSLLSQEMTHHLTQTSRGDYGYQIRFKLHLNTAKLVSCNLSFLDSSAITQNHA